MTKLPLLSNLLRI